MIGKAVNGLMSPDDNTDDFLEDSLDVLQPTLLESSKLVLIVSCYDVHCINVF